MKRWLVAALAVAMGLVGLVSLTSTSTATAAALPAPVPTQWKSVSTAGYTSCGIDVQQKLYCWGYDGYGQLGNGETDGGNHPTPTKVDNANWLSVRVAYYNVCGVRTDHTAYCWGYDGYGANGTNSPRPTEGSGYVSTPTKVFGTVQWARVATGYAASCGISTTGKLYCWGNDGFGSLGDGPGDSSNRKPRQVGTASNWVSVTTGYYTSCAVNTAQQGFCWGRNSEGEVGGGTNTDAFTPQRLPGAWKNINTVAYTSCGVTTSNVSQCWGYNSYGQVGDATTDNRNQPTTLSEQSTDFRRVLPGYYATCGIRTADNAVRCFGYNGSGQFGDGTYDNSTLPVPGAGGKAGWKQIAVGDDTTCGLRTNGKLFCWGYNYYGQTGVEGGESYLPDPHQVGTTYTAPPSERRQAPKKAPVDHGPMKNHGPINKK